jgi:hypothetical protein
MASTTVVCTEDDTCCFCWDEVEDGITYYCPPCGHFFCYICMDQNALLNKCTRCNQDFVVAFPAKVVLPIIIHDDDDDDASDSQSGSKIIPSW